MFISKTKELAVMSVVLVFGVLGPSIFLASNFQEYNGKHPK
jgi:hypothetical protein